MKRFLAKLVCLVGFHFAVLAVVFALYVKRFPPSQSFYAGSLDKHQLLATSASPRLVFVGGSSMALGMDSELVARPLGFNPINMGMNVAIGLEFMLDEVLPSLKTGDVVVLAPEYHAMQKFYQGNPEYISRLVECRPSLLRGLAFTYWKRLLDRGYLQHLGLVYRTMAGWHMGQAPFDGVTNQYNSRQAFNQFGDVIAHHGVEIRRGSPLRFEFTSLANAETAIAHMNRFYRDCRRRGVRVFFSHPPYERRFFDLYQPQLAQLETLLKNKLEIPMLDSAEEMTFAKDEIFDVEYHLNLPGKLRRSQQVAQRLRLALASHRETSRNDAVGR